MDFFHIHTKESKGGAIEVFPDFVVGRSKDLMVRGRSFYAIWDEELGLWSTDEYDVQRLVDHELNLFAEDWKEKTGTTPAVKRLSSYRSKGWSEFQSLLRNVSDNSTQLDQKLIFSNTKTQKSDYASKKLPYPLEEGDVSAWDELLDTLYEPEERAKIEWAIGAVVSGDSKKIQKFLVFYGSAGTGKSTVLSVIEQLFQGYTTTFEAKALGSNGAGFSTEVFKHDPIVAIQHDGDLSRIEDNTRLNSIISHETMTMNEKYKASYSARVNAFLFMGTNQPVKISDSKSGIIRRLIDVRPTGNRFPVNHYNALMSRIDFELGAIAYHCLQVYQEMGKNYYSAYRPTEMMFQTDIFFNFVEANFDVFKAQDGVSLKQAYSMYKMYCAETGIDKPLPMYKLRDEFKSYFEEFHEKKTIDGVTYRSYYSGFTAHPFRQEVDKDGVLYSLVMDETISLLDKELAGCIAQYAKDDGTPAKRWNSVKTTLSDLDTSQVHYVKVPKNHIVIDFDLKGSDGEKSLEECLKAASQWPPTYAELSKSGNGVHLHYNYDGTADDLVRLHSEGIEIKVYAGDASLRRMRTRCNAVPVSTIRDGLRTKDRKVITENTIKSEKSLRAQITRNLRKEIHPGTKPSIDFIKKILDDAYASGLVYDVTDMRSTIVAFAANSTNQALACLKIVQQMKFQSESKMDRTEPTIDEKPLVFFDVEVYPNLFVICWKYEGDDNVVKMINPSAQDVERLFPLKLVGFNNRRYDNHILYGAYMGYDNKALFELSQAIINGRTSAMFGEAYNLSYADIYDFSSVKQSLKKFGINLGMHHMEMDLEWDQPVTFDKWDAVVEYCVNDVITTEATFNDRKGDYTARLILSELSGLPVNNTTQRHTAQIVFGDDRRPQDEFVYTDLSKEFPGYTFDLGKSAYRDEEPGEGGYVYAEPGMYSDVALLDVASMHPTTIVNLNMFGDRYTANFSALMEARLAIKSGDFESARKMYFGKLAPFLGDEENAKALSYALKIAINIVYGLTSAKFDNPFRDNKNMDNIAAKRGSLFMIDLKHAVQEQGFTVAHIKTDSIKIPNATPEIIEFVKNFGDKYGYKFEHEATYDKLCLVNDAVYVARIGEDWTTVGAQFQHPYVYKTLFTHEMVQPEDLFETKQVTQGVMYLDNVHVGRIGQFVPVVENGFRLWRVKDDKQYAVTGTKDYFWLEAEVWKQISDMSQIDMSYYKRLADEAHAAIDYFGPFAELVKG